MSYGLPTDAEIKQMYLASEKKPRICSLTPLNEDVYGVSPSSDSVTLSDEMYQEYEVFKASDWATYYTKNGVFKSVIVKPTNLSEKYVEDEHFCLGRYTPDGRVIVKSPEVKNGEINSFRVTLETSQQRDKGVPSEFEKLAIFDSERSIGIAFQKIEGKWEIARTAVQAFVK